MSKVVKKARTSTRNVDRANESGDYPRALEPSEGRREPVGARSPEVAAIGPFEPNPGYAGLEKASTATLFVQSLTQVATDEPLAGGLDQLAAEMAVFACFLGSDSDLLTSDVLYRVASGYEQRIRVLAALARKTLGAEVSS